MIYMDWEIIKLGPKPSGQGPFLDKKYGLNVRLLKGLSIQQMTFSKCIEETHQLSQGQEPCKLMIIVGFCGHKPFV